jgi:DNA mismatch repair protein MutH
MASPDYDKTSISSIFDFAFRLVGKSLGEALSSDDRVVNLRDRGNFGTLVERYYFKHQPPNDHKPDFPEAMVELKTTGVTKKKDLYRAKERLVLSMIDFESIVTEEWETSRLVKKCDLMLILPYEYTSNVLERRFVLEPLLVSITGSTAPDRTDERRFLRRVGLKVSPDDISQLKRDWEAIRDKVRAGKAHELSEGDTFFLGACRKGPGGEKEALRKQPNSTTKAKARAYSLKPGFVNKLLNEHLTKTSVETTESRLGVGRHESFEQATRKKFDEYLGKSLDEIAQRVGYIGADCPGKGFKRDLAVRILAGEGSSVRELEMAEIEMKTIGLNKHGRAKESMSFPNFDYLKILDEEWEDSIFFERIERKFLFIVFQEGEQGETRLRSVLYWNMPYEDRQEARRVWEETKRRVAIDARNLPTSSESYVAHVRPKARNGNDTALTPQGEMLVKKCFWLNNRYITNVVADFEARF